MKKEILILSVIILSTQLSNADETKKRAVEVCKTEIMYAAKPPRLEDCVMKKLASPDYKSVLTYETFESLKYDESPKE